MNLKKIFSAIFVLFGACFILSSSADAGWFEKYSSFVPSNTVDKNDVWVGTFQLVWNDFQDKIVKAPIKFEGETPKLVEELNRQSFKSSMLSENSYFKAYGEKSLELKEEIEKGLMEKFGERSSIIDSVDWTSSQGYVVYAMLKKEFKYLSAFPELSSAPFYGSDERIRYFGIDKNTSNPTLYQNVDVLFYNSENSYAIKLKTKEGEEIILYRTDDNKSFDDLYSAVMKKQKRFWFGKKELGEQDLLKVPYIKFSKQFSYDELCNKKIVGTNGLFIDKAIQTVEFGLDNQGGNLKSEAMVISTMSLIRRDGGREFFFDKPFVLFMKEANQDRPYFALKVRNSDLLEKVSKQ